LCGPFSRDPLEASFQRFASCRLIGINLSMKLSREAWNPFDLLIDRDTQTTGNPTLSSGVGVDWFLSWGCLLLNLTA
jgi:hypothetical protein